MNIEVRRTEHKEVANLRDLHRHEAHCQIKGDSMIARGLADPYLILADGRVAGYGAVWNKHYVGRLMEFYVLPHLRPHALPLFREVLKASQATHIEAQTNLPLMLGLLYDCATDITVENILFHDATTTNLLAPPGTFRRSTPGDSIGGEAPADWVIEANDTIVASGGFLCHYNPPYGDVFMEVAETARRQGYGSYLVQEIKRVAYESGKLPAARCDPANVASRRTLEKAGLLPCGRLLAGRVRTDW